jgi:NADPH-dependent glutamate synthase beta subunit-like oxidoreductase
VGIKLLLSEVKLQHPVTDTQPNMSSTTVAIIGAGIAGPLLAVFLKNKGYDPVLYERTESRATGGLSLA